MSLPDIATSEAAIQKRGIDYFRRAVALIYREIGVLRVANHKVIAEKANMTGGFFGPDRKMQAKQLYKLSLTDSSVAHTRARYLKRTGLTLEEVHEAFHAGSWRSASGGFAFGGPKWAAISAAAIELGSAIQAKAWPEVQRLTNLIDRL
jgi:hypothetical protein